VAHADVAPDFARDYIRLDELAVTTGAAFVRDSKNPEGPAPARALPPSCVRWPVVKVGHGTTRTGQHGGRGFPATPAAGKAAGGRRFVAG
jgi:hypothetical protein